MESEFDMSIPCRYMGDEGRIKQILINILNNALKFTEKGHVRISVAGMPGETDDMEILVFRITDTGCGIREEDLEGIFENFKQVDSKRNRSVEGTGLGLSITKHYINLMKGTIRVESVYGEGSTFIVEIPQKIMDRRPLSEVPERTAREEDILEPLSVKDCTALVVDDNMINRKVARLRLQAYGFEIEEADNGPDAIELVRNKRYDIIFMDHMMPKMDGLEAASIIRKDCGENGRLPIMSALTANAMEGVRENFLASGFQDFITKPLEIKPMHEALLKWIPKEKRIAGKEWTKEEWLDNNKHEEFQDILIEGIDTDEVAKYYSGSVEEYQELLRLYCLDGKRKLVHLRELWEKGDYESYGIEVHGLKSASANVGAMKVSNSAREHENAVNRGDETFVDSNISKLLTEYEQQIEYILNFLDKNRKTEDVKEKVQEMEQDDLLREIKDALDSLENFRAKDCAHKIKDILQYRLNSDIERKLEEIQEQLKLYEDDAAEEMLRDLIKQIEMEV